MVGELSSEKAIHWYLCARAGDLNTAFTAFDEEDTYFITGYGKVDLLPFAIMISFPRNKNTLV
jgi:hypothetical protein